MKAMLVPRIVAASTHGLARSIHSAGLFAPAWTLASSHGALPSPIMPQDMRGRGDHGLPRACPDGFESATLKAPQYRGGRWRMRSTYDYSTSSCWCAGIGEAQLTLQPCSRIREAQSGL